jgi:hypothetical protein
MKSLGQLIRRGNHVVLVTLLSTSVVKLGFMRKVIGPQQPGLLFIYLGYVIWIVVQVVYAKSGKGAALFDWEPILITGYLFIGIPWVLYLLLRKVKERLNEMKKI